MGEGSDTSRLALARRVRLKRDDVRGIDVLLLPESVIELNPQGAAIVRMCDGTRTLPAIVEELRALHPGADVEADVRAFVARLLERGVLTSTS